MSINLLSKEQKAKNRKEYFWRLASVAFFMFSVAVLFGTVLLIPSLIFSSTKHDLLLEQVHELDISDVSARESELRTIIQNTNKRTTLLDQGGSKGMQAISMLSEVLSVQRSGIVFTRLLYERTDKGVKFIVMGEADRRNTLLAFRDDLQELERFTHVNFPTGNLVSESDISFTVELLIEPGSNKI